MSVPAPGLYRGRVRHTRYRPVAHDFTYRVYYGLFDIDDLDALSGRLRLFSHGRFNLFGFDRADHGPADGSPLRPWAEEGFGHAGVDVEAGRIMLLAFPRLLGYAFNPISVWLGYSPEGRLVGVLHEVRNTFGDRHTYALAVSDGGLRHGTAKKLHVSPFNGMEQTYRFSLSEPGETFGLGIAVDDSAGNLFRAGMRLRRLEWTDANLARLFVTHPLLTLKVISAIHWQALKIWVKGGRYHPVPAAPTNRFTVAEPAEVQR